jgi:hypothetical protein
VQDVLRGAWGFQAPRDAPSHQTSVRLQGSKGIKPREAFNMSSAISALSFDTVPSSGTGSYGSYSSSATDPQLESLLGGTTGLQPYFSWEKTTFGQNGNAGTASKAAQQLFGSTNPQGTQGSGNGQFDSALLQVLIALLQELNQSISSNDGSVPTSGSVPTGGYGGGGGGGGGSYGSGSRAVGSTSTGSTSSGPVQHGDSNVAPAGSGNPAGIAQGLLDHSAASIMANQNVPMDRGIPTDVCCANFVSACLTKAGELPESQHTNSVATLDSELKQDGWHTESRSQAKPGDVVIIGGDEHTEIVASNDNGRITLIGSNNTEGGSGPQVVSYDSASGNRGNVEFLSKS